MAATRAIHRDARATGASRVRRTRDRSVRGATRAFSSDRHREGSSRETTRATRTSPFFSCATTSGVTRSTATPRSDPILPRGDATGTRRARLEVTEAGEGGASPAVFLVALATERVARWFDAKPALFEDAVVMSSKRARSKRRASQRPVRVSSAHHGNPREFAREASARRARRGARSRAPGSCLPVAQATA